VFPPTPSAFSLVVVACRPVVRDGRHLLVPDVAAALDRAIGALLELAP
jgi:hypothetical protein